MSISSIGNTNTLSALSSLNNNTTTSSTDETSGTASTPATSTNMSKPGELMNKLSQLLSQDPAKFKEVTQQISDQLQAAAQNASGPQASFLNKLSADFAQASSSGSLSPLQPPQGARAGGHAGGAHHHHGGGNHGGGGAMEQVMSSALDAVNQALQGTSASTTSGTSGVVAS